VKRLIVLIFSMAAAIGFSMMPASASTHVSPKPAVEINGNYYFQNVANALWLHGHAVGDTLSDVTSADQTWDIVDLQDIGGYSYAEVRLHGTNDCANAVIAQVAVFLNGCKSGASDYNELWYIPSDGYGGNWFISADNITNPYWGDGSNHNIALVGMGDGNYALWGGECNNC
jgi:hypothetical protein